VGVGVNRLRDGGVLELMLDDLGLDVLMKQGVL
jgi:hypothetical protein